MQAGCPACGAVNKPGAKFCNECGTALVAGTRPVPTGMAPPTALDLSAAVGRATERRVVSVLFADLDPEAVREFLD